MITLLTNVCGFTKASLVDLCKLLTVGAVYATVGFLVSVLFMLILLTPMYLIYGL